jgi:predicted esterase YcpF (UPF0227 family)
MTRPAIAYLHGFNSAPQSVKGRSIAAAAAALPDPPVFHLPYLGHRPLQAVRDLGAWIERAFSDRRDVTLIGSSLGGYFATWLAEKYPVRAILVNPAVRPCEDLQPYLGRQRNLYTGEEYEVTRTHFEELAALAVARIARPERYFLLVRTGDEVLDWRAAVEFYSGAFQFVAGGGDHGWTDFGDEIASVLRFAGCAA